MLRKEDFGLKERFAFAILVGNCVDAVVEVKWW